MAREYARIRLRINTDPHFLSLGVEAQFLYARIMLTHGSLTACGVMDWRPPRLTSLARNLSLDFLLTGADELERERFALFDLDTEEALVRTLIRNDDLLRNPKMALSVVKAYSAVASQTLRAVVVSELHRAKAEQADYSSWTHPLSRQQLAHLLTLPQSDSVGYTNRIGDLITNRKGNGITNRIGNPVGNGNGNRIGNADSTVFYQQTTDLIPQTSNMGGSAGRETYLPHDSNCPPRFCPKHPNGTDKPCIPCGNARKAHEAWETNAGDRQRAAHRAVIDACEWCDERGLRIEPSELRDHDWPAVRCDHTPWATSEWPERFPEVVNA